MSTNSLVVIAALVVLLLIWPAIRRVLKLLLFRTAARVALKDVGNRALAKQIDEVHLVRKDIFRGSALDDDREQMTKPLVERGFSRIGLFDVPEMPGLDIFQLVNVNTSVYVNLYSHPRAGKWFELVTRYQDGRFVAFSTQPDRGLEQRPGDVHVHAPGSDSGTLYDRMLRERPQGAMVTLTSEEVPRLFEKGYRELMFWRKHKGLS